MWPHCYMDSGDFFYLPMYNQKTVTTLVNSWTWAQEITHFDSCHHNMWPHCYITEIFWHTYLVSIPLIMLIIKLYKYKTWVSTSLSSNFSTVVYCLCQNTPDIFHWSMSHDWTASVQLHTANVHVFCCWYFIVFYFIFTHISTKLVFNCAHVFICNKFVINVSCNLHLCNDIFFPFFSKWPLF